MRTRSPIHLLCFFGILLIIAAACQSTSSPAATPTPASDIPITGQDSSSSPPSSQSANAPVALPAERANQASDMDSSKDANKKRVPGGDTFVRNLYERPLNADPMDVYFPYLDIVDTQGFKDDTWGFATVTMSGTDSNGHLPGKYGVELDLNKDGRGEWLILASNPSATDWTTQGVQAWHDGDGDVGGEHPVLADNANGGNGYETLVFGQNKGDDAWVMVSDKDPKTVILAFKLSMVGNPESFAMGAWAGSDSLNPAMFDLNDHMTHIEAGSPLPDLYVYPLKQLAEIDNTCRMAIAFVPTGNEPGLCGTVDRPKPGDEVTAGCTPTAAGAGCQ